MAFLPFAISGGLGLLGSLFGGQSQNSQQLSQLLNQLMGNETQVLNQTEQSIGGLNTEAGMYTGILPGLSANMGAENAGAGSMAPLSALQYMLNASSPGALQATTGVDQFSPTQTLLSYLSKPGSTDVGKMSGSMIKELMPGGKVSDFYGREMKHGLSKQVQTNAQNQLQQNYQQSLANIDASAKPGQNLNSAQQVAQNTLLQQSSNLGGQLAMDSQQIKQQGAAGIQGALQQALQTGGAADAQKMQMLQEAMQSAMGYNQTALGNEAAGAGFGQNVLSGLSNFAGQGMQAQEYGLGTLASLFSSLSSQTSGIAGAAMGANQSSNQSNPFSFLSGLPWSGLFGGASGAGATLGSGAALGWGVGP